MAASPGRTLPIPPVPAVARDGILAISREHRILDHGFDLDVDWWNPKLVERRLPGGPLMTADGATSGRGRIDRRLLFSLADDALEDETGEAALRLLWPVLLWGTGDTNRLNKKRIASVAKDPKAAGKTLRDAAKVSREDPGRAFLILRPGRRNVITSLGPGFFTKFLYFSGGGDPQHPCTIVDSAVLGTLERELPSAPVRRIAKSNYGVDTYRWANDVLHTWATELSTTARRVAADEVERWAFGR